MDRPQVVLSCGTFFKHFCPYVSDLEQLTQTNSQTLKYGDLLSCKEMEETNLIIVEESYHIAIVAESFMVPFMKNNKALPSAMKYKKRSDTEFVDIAELVMPDLEDLNDTVFEGFSQLDCNSYRPLVNWQGISISKLQAAPRTLPNLNIKIK